VANCVLHNSETTQDNAIQENVNIHSHSVYQNSKGVIFNDLEWSKPRFRGHSIFWSWTSWSRLVLCRIWDQVFDFK